MPRTERGSASFLRTANKSLLYFKIASTIEQNVRTNVRTLNQMNKNKF